MLLELAILLASGLMVFIAGQVVYKIINCRLALIEFKKKSKGIPMCPDGSLLGNHIVSVILRPNICDFIVEVHGKLGKYIGLLIGDRQFCISTLDLDLVKTIILDESDQHFDRLQPGLPLDEYENSMMLAPEAEWRPVRRVVAPALK